MELATQESCISAPQTASQQQHDTIEPLRRCRGKRDMRQLQALCLLLVLPSGYGAITSSLSNRPSSLQQRRDEPNTTATARPHPPRGGGIVRKAVRNRRKSFTTAKAGSTRGQDDPTVLNRIRWLFLCYYGSLGSLLPYLPVYYDSLGHGGQIIGMLGAVKPATTFIVAPLWGMISDAAPSPFGILQLTFLVSLLGQLGVSYRTDARFLLITVFVTALFNAPVKSLLDSMVMDHLQDPRSYGRLRLWGQLGFGLGSSGVGLLLSRYSKRVPWPEQSTFSPWTERNVLSKLPGPVAQCLVFVEKSWRCLTGYKLLFFVHAALSVPTWMCIRDFRQLDRERLLDAEQSTSSSKQNAKSAAKSTAVASTKANSNGIGQGLLLVLSNPDALLFFFLVFVVGISSGVIENFAYVRMREVGGTGKEMGLSRLVSSLAGAPMFWFSGPLTQALGVDLVLVLSLVSYVLRFLLYAGMRNPYHGLPAEALRGVTFAAFWSTSTVYAHNISPPGLHATMLMALNALYGGLGQSLGAVLGGKLQYEYGTALTFLYAAGFDAAFVAVLVLYLYAFRGTRERTNS